MIDEEEKGRLKVHHPERNTTRAMANNLNANTAHEKSRPWKTPYRAEIVPKRPKCYIHLCLCFYFVSTIQQTASVKVDA